MKTSSEIAAGVVLLVGSLGVASASDGQGSCREVQAQIIDAKTTVDCTSAYNFCASGTVEGNRGLNGTTYFVLDGVGTRPDTTTGLSVSSGLLVYTTYEGTLTVRETALNKLSPRPANGVLAALQEVVSGTGRFAGASGTLFNTATAVDGTFYSTITGTLCLLPRKPRHD